MTRKEISSLCRSMNNIGSWRHSFDCVELSEKLYSRILKIITHCETQFKWNMEKLKRNVRLLRNKFFFSASCQWDYISSDEDITSELTESAEEGDDQVDKSQDKDSDFELEQDSKITFF